MSATLPLKDRIADQMAVIGFGLAVTYWFIRTLLFVLTESNISLYGGLITTDTGEITGRLLTLCFFMIFGSHANYTIKQRKLADEARIASEGKYRAIIEGIDDGYFEIDPGGHFTFYNAAMCRLIGYSPKEMAQMGFDRAMPKPQAEALRQSLVSIRETGQPIKSLEFVFDVRGAGRRHAEASIAPIYDAKGNMTGFRGLVRDLTERRKSEALQREKQAAEAANRSKSEFLANMSHEIRTPLNSIIGMVEILQQGDLTDEQQEDLAVVHSASYALLSVINDILDFSKIEAGKLELEATAFDIRALVEESMKIMAPKAHQKHLDLAYRIGPEIPAILVGDPARLRQVILNLLGNAVKFTDRGEIVLELVGAPGADDAVEAHLSLKDTGIGVPPEKQETIFQAFSQADASTTRRFGGTGLGLTVSSQLVSLMGGRIWVESQPNQGSTFHFTARFGKARIDGLALETPGDNDLAGVRALVVDDHAATREILCDLLKQMDVFPAATGDAHQARELLQQRAKRGIPYEVVFVDAALADGAGLELVRWLQSEGRLASRPVLLTTHTGTGPRHDTAASGAAARIVKPVGAADVRKALAKALGLQPKAAADGQKSASGEFAGPLSILVAEDLPFNQKFIQRLLEKWGHRVTFAATGRQAVQALGKTAYDLILMDVQMPEMDGLEATRHIRDTEKTTGQGRTPIIAMTAHAMKGDRERCLEAGMDDYVSKPIVAEQLARAMRKLAPQRGTGQSARQERVAAPATPNPAPPAPEPRHRVDLKELTQMVGGDLDFLKELIETFLADSPRQVDTICKAFKTSQTDVLGRAAHDLKGMLRSFNLEQTAAVAERLERLALKGPWDEATGRNLCATLTADLAGITRAVQAQLGQMTKEPGSDPNP